MSEINLGSLSEYQEKLAAQAASDQMNEAAHQAFEMARDEADQENMFRASAEGIWLSDRDTPKTDQDVTLEHLQSYHEVVEAFRPSLPRPLEFRELGPNEAAPEVVESADTSMKVVVTNTTYINAIADSIVTNPIHRAEYLSAEKATSNYDSLSMRQLKAIIKDARTYELEMVARDAEAALAARRQAKADDVARRAAEVEAARQALEAQLAADQAAQEAAQQLDRSKVSPPALQILDFLNGDKVTQPQPRVNTGEKTDEKQPTPEPTPEPTPKPAPAAEPTPKANPSQESPKSPESAPKLKAVLAHYSEIAQGGDDMDRITANTQLGLYTMVEDLSQPGATAAEAMDKVLNEFWSTHAAELNTESAFDLMVKAIVTAESMLREEFGVPENATLPLTALKFFEDEAGSLHAVLGHNSYMQLLYVSEVEPDGTIKPIVQLIDDSPVKVLVDIGRDTRFALVSDGVTNSEHPISDQDIKDALAIPGEANLVAERLFEKSTAEGDDKSVIVIDVESTVAQPRDDAFHEAGKAAKAQTTTPPRPQTRREARRARQTRNAARRADRRAAGQPEKGTAETAPKKEQKGANSPQQSTAERLKSWAIRNRLDLGYASKVRQKEIDRLIEEQKAIEAQKAADALRADVRQGLQERLAARRPSSSPEETEPRYSVRVGAPVTAEPVVMTPYQQSVVERALEKMSPTINQGLDYLFPTDEDGETVKPTEPSWLSRAARYTGRMLMFGARSPRYKRGH